MAKDQFWEDNNPYGWRGNTEHLISDMPQYHEFMKDPMSQFLIESAFFGPANRVERTISREWIREYWRDRWGYDFAEQFDWQGYRELYNS